MVALEDCDWDLDWNYAFGLDGRRDSLDPYGESPSSITGTLLHPPNPSIGAVELWRLPIGDLDDDKRKESGAV